MKPVRWLFCGKEQWLLKIVATGVKASIPVKHQTVEPLWNLSLAYNISALTTQKAQLFHCCSATVALLRICCLATGTCLLDRCPETALVYPSISRSLHWKGAQNYAISVNVSDRLQFRLEPPGPEFSNGSSRYNGSDCLRLAWRPAWKLEILSFICFLCYPFSLLFMSETNMRSLPLSQHSLWGMA
jgi:hypothetical protein